MSSQSSNPFTSSQLSEEDVAAIAALRKQAYAFKRQGFGQQAWECAVNAMAIVNCATLQKLAANTFKSNEEMIYGEAPREYPGTQNADKKEIQLTLLLIEGSELTKKIIQVLEEDARGNNRRDS